MFTFIGTRGTVLVVFCIAPISIMVGAFLGFILNTGIKMIIVAVYVMIFVFSFVR